MRLRSGHAGAQGALPLDPDLRLTAVKSRNARPRRARESGERETENQGKTSAHAASSAVFHQNVKLADTEMPMEVALFNWVFLSISFPYLISPLPVMAVVN